MSIILVVIYTLSSGATNHVIHPVDSMAECYQRGTAIVVARPNGSVTYKCRIGFEENV